MSRIDIQRISKREGDRVMQSSVRRRVVYRNRCVCQTRDELLHPADTLDTTNRRAKGRAVPIRVSASLSFFLKRSSCNVPELEIKTIIKAFPFLLGEEFTELGVSKGDSLHHPASASIQDATMIGHLPRKHKSVASCTLARSSDQSL